MTQILPDPGVSVFLPGAPRAAHTSAPPLPSALARRIATAAGRQRRLVYLPGMHLLRPSRKSAVVALAALSALAGVVLRVMPDPVSVPHRPPSRAAPARPRVTVQPPHATTSRRPDTRSSPSTRAAARNAARDFLSGYPALSHGRTHARALERATAELRRELRRHPPRVTPAQRENPARIRQVGVTAHTRASARALAIVQDTGGPPYRLRLYLERRGERWLVTRIGDA